MREFGFDYRRPVPSGRVVFHVRNRGLLTHEMLVLSLPEDFPPVDVQLRSGKPATVPTVASHLRPAGSSGRFALDLSPGRYAMVCLIRDPDGVVHASKGMTSEFRVSE